MSGIGKVLVVDLASEPQTNKPSRRVTVERTKDGVWLNFFIPLDGPFPAIGDAISWDAKHADFNGQRVHKSYEHDPNEPLH